MKYWYTIALQWPWCYKDNVNKWPLHRFQIQIQIQNLYCINNHHVWNTTEAILTMWATLHYTTNPSMEASRTTNTTQNKTHLYIDTRTHVHVRVWKYTHISKRTHTRIHVYIYIYINTIHLTHGARPPPFCHPLSLSNHSKSRWQSGGNHIEWDTHIYIHFKSKLPLLIQAFSKHNSTSGLAANGG